MRKSIQVEEVDVEVLLYTPEYVESVENADGTLTGMHVEHLQHPVVELEVGLRKSNVNVPFCKYLDVLVEFTRNEAHVSVEQEFHC